MDPLVRYYLYQAGRGKNDGIGPIYEAPRILQRGYGVGRFLTGLWRVVRPVVWIGGRNLERETLRTRDDNLIDIARSSDENPRDIISRRVNETTQNLIGKLRERGRKRKAGIVKRKKGGK